MPKPSFDTQTTFGELASRTARMLKHGRWHILVTLILATLWIGWNGQPGLFAFIALAAGAFLILSMWQRLGRGVPVLPMLALQTLVTYGVPIVANNASMQNASAETLLRCGIELFLFQIALAASWYLCRQLIPPAAPTAWSINLLVREQTQGLTRLGFWLAGGSTAYEVASGMGWTASFISSLPAGSNSILVAITSAAAMAGFFVLGLSAAGGHLTQQQRGVMWALFLTRSLVATLSLLLSVPIMGIAALATGLLWGGARFPWRFLGISLCVLAFLNLGKADMRTRYWPQADNDTPPPASTVSDIPDRYAEWAQLSLARLNPAREVGYTTAKERQTLLDRIDNLQNLIFVVQAVEGNRIPTLDGATYWLIPPLLVPRFLWPEKPRAHEGQALLNVHFGRQIEEDTYKTYIAWGLIPEAYGNFGAWWGSLFLGGLLGSFAAWLEMRTANKPVFSLEGFLTIALLLGLAVSSEMVASVLITSQFQQLVLIICAAAPFVRRTVLTPRETPAG
jgi:hypothetical protein